MPTSNAEVINALHIAIKECKDPYAQTYLHALPLAVELYQEEGAVVQLLYALDNMASWRGLQAREVKAVLRGFIKSLGY